MCRVYDRVYVYSNSSIHACVVYDRAYIYISSSIDTCMCSV